MRIALDPGHGGTDQGADGPNGLNEAPVVLEIAKLVADRLKEIGQSTLLTRDTDASVALGARTKAANNWDADYFVSIHLNSNGPSAVGVETLYASDKGKALAAPIQVHLVNATGDVDRGLKQRGDLYVLNGTHMPACLVECGFISNPETEAKFATSEYKNWIAQAIVAGIAQFLGISPEHKPMT